MNEKYKAIIIVTFLMTFLASALVWQGANQYNKAFNVFLIAGEEDLKSSTNSLEDYSFTPYRQRIKNLLRNNPQIIDAFATRKRALLYKLSLPKYQALKRENKFFTVMHFHLPDGKTFLRVHIPEFYDDDLTTIRPIVTAVHKHQKPLSGFEIGRSGPFFRVVEPIFSEGIYVGAFELGFLTHQVIDIMSRQDNLILTTYFHKEPWKKASLFDVTKTREMDNFFLITHKNDLYDLLPPDIVITDETKKLTLNDRSFLLLTKPLFENFEGKEIGGIIALQDITHFIANKKTFLSKALAFSFFMVLICLFVIYFYFDKILGALLSEITERRKTEKALRTSESLFRSLVHDLPNIAVQGYNKNREVILWNKGSELLYGFTQEEALNQKIENLIIPEEMKSEVITAIDDWINLGVPMPSSEVTLRRKDGSAIPVFSSHSLSFKLKNEPELYCVDVDLKELRDAQTQQTLMAQQLVKAQKMEAIGLMAGGVAHDLNNILSGIVSYPELLLMQLPPDSTMRKPLETIKESGIRAADVVADLLTVARGVAKTTEIDNPNNFINTYLQSPEYNELCRRHPHIEIISHLQPNLKNIRCSGVHIMKMITNLMNNAAEAIDEKGTIAISTSMVQLEEDFALEYNIEPGEYCLLSISDDGPGIKPDDLARIFEPFFTKKMLGRSGTGLGLTVVWNTMKDHGGVVVAESSPKNCLFKLYFPARDEESSVIPESKNLANYRGNGETILIVDDDKQQRIIAERVLNLMGYDPKTASSGEKALDYLQNHKVDLVVLDMIMDPGINGKETYARILELYPGQKAIIASGFSESDDVKETIKMGAGHYIKKPYTMAQLGNAVKSELSKEKKT